MRSVCGILVGRSQCDPVVHQSQSMPEFVDRGRLLNETRYWARGAQSSLRESLSEKLSKKLCFAR